MRIASAALLTFFSFVIFVSCSKEKSSIDPPPVNTGDLFPISTGSWWSFDQPGIATDSVFYKMTGPELLNGTPYWQFLIKTDFIRDTSATKNFHRKSGDDYYWYGYVTLHSNIILDSSIVGEYIFLKENLHTGDTWSSPVYSGTEDGKPVQFKYVFTCTEANVSKTVNGRNFQNVYVVTQKVEGTVDGVPYVPMEFPGNYTFYYARGIGRIYIKSESQGKTDLESFIRNWNIK
jgi:hypothetical protein